LTRTSTRPSCESYTVYLVCREWHPQGESRSREVRELAAFEAISFRRPVGRRDLDQVLRRGLRGYGDREGTVVRRGTEFRSTLTRGDAGVGQRAAGEQRAQHHGNHHEGGPLGCAEAVAILGIFPRTNDVLLRHGFSPSKMVMTIDFDHRTQRLGQGLCCGVVCYPRGVTRVCHEMAHLMPEHKAIVHVGTLPSAPA